MTDRDKRDSFGGEGERETGNGKLGKRKTRRQDEEVDRMQVKFERNKADG
jgi:hypothetical protein